MAKSLSAGARSTWLVAGLVSFVGLPAASAQIAGSAEWSDVGADVVQTPIDWHIYQPDGSSGAGLLLLHGWDMDCASWRDSTSIFSLADELGWTLICPELERSVYEWEMLRGASEGGGASGEGPVMEQLVTDIERLTAVLDWDGLNVMGFSTGGRGVGMLVSTQLPIRCAASLSGTFDLASLEPGSGEYRIHARAWGEREENLALWARHEACVPTETCIEPRWWLGHGAEDSIVAPAQSIGFGTQLADAGALVTTWLGEGEGHDLHVLQSGAQEASAWFRDHCVEQPAALDSDH